MGTVEKADKSGLQLTLCFTKEEILNAVENCQILALLKNRATEQEMEFVQNVARYINSLYSASSNRDVQRPASGICRDTPEEAFRDYISSSGQTQSGQRISSARSNIKTLGD